MLAAAVVSRFSGHLTRHIPEHSGFWPIAAMVHLLMGYVAWHRSAKLPGMSDTTGDTSHNTTDVSHNATVDVATAAQLLGISDEAVRARIRRGKLRAEKVGALWRVHIPDGEPVGTQTPPPQPSRDTTSRHATEHTTEQNTESSELVDHLRGEVTYLRERLEEADRQRGYLQQQLEAERQRADVLQALGTGTTPETASEAVGSPQSDGTGQGGIWTWWRRLLGRE